MHRKIPQESLFGIQLPGELEFFLHRTNPWWYGEPMHPLRIFAVGCSN